MARRSRKQTRSGRRVRKRELIAELSCKRDPEILKELAQEAMRILEDPESDDFVKAAARGQLAMSAVVYKFWRFFMPPDVEIEFVFEHRHYADEFAEKVGRFVDARRATRIIDGKAYPSVRVSWRQWHAMKIVLGGSIEPPDVIAEDFTRQRNPRRALDRLMRDILLFSTITGTEPVIADIDENHYEE